MVVNMTNGTDMSVTLMADSTLLHSGQPFFIPDFAPHFAAMPMLMLRVGRLGKCIAPRFAHRYIDAMTASFAIVPLDHDMQPMSLAGMASVMDGATVYGSWIDYEPLQSFVWTLGGQEHTLLPQDFMPEASAAIEHISRHATIKMGDVICLGATASQPQPLHIDDLLTASVNGQPILRNKIK